MTNAFYFLKQCLAIIASLSSPCPFAYINITSNAKSNYIMRGFVLSSSRPTKTMTSSLSIIELFLTVKWRFSCVVQWQYGYNVLVLSSSLFRYGLSLSWWFRLNGDGVRSFWCTASTVEGIEAGTFLLWPHHEAKTSNANTMFGYIFRSILI